MIRKRRLASDRYWQYNSVSSDGANGVSHTNLMCVALVLVSFGCDSLVVALVYI